MGAHPKTPLEALYLETGSIPIRFIVACRRILYLHAILHKDENEMIPKIYEAQKIKPSSGDFINLVKNDFETIGLEMNELEIKQISKQKFKKMIKSKVRDAAFSYLKSLQMSHSKMKDIQYEKFEMSNYLSSPMFSKNERCLLLALRTRTVRGVRSDFPGLYRDKMCPLGCGEQDNIPNILLCRVLNQYQKSESVTDGKINYNDIFSNNIEKQKQVTELYKDLLEIRNRLINSQPVACTGPVQNMHILQNHSVI